MAQKNLPLPIVIILIGLIISAGIYFSRITPIDPQLAIPDNSPKEEILTIDSVNDSDYIYGNPEAEILIIEYSDFECPYCQVFHATMNRIMDRYAKTGRVAWVYRHFPIVDIHPNAYGAALASECVGDFGRKNNNSNLFWKFSNLIFNEVPESLKLENLRKTALEIGVESATYDACMLLETHKPKIERNIQDGLNIMAKDSEFGTPYNLIISKSGLQTRISGSEDYSELVNTIELILNQ